MYAEFFRQQKPRHENPTFQSNLVHSTLLYPYSKYQLIQSRYEQKNNIIRNNNSSTMGIASQHDPNPNPSMMLEKRLSREIIPKFQMSSSTLISEDPYRHRRSKSNLSSYGSNSLSNLTKASDKLVYENQQKDFNIVSLIPNQYNQSIKMYPKLRNQRKQDHPNKIRQAFIAGKSQQGLAQSKIFLSNQSNESKRKNSQTSRRLNPEYTE